MGLAVAKKRRLTDKQRAFIDAYLRCLNGYRAAKEAKYNGDEATLRAIASENLSKPNIRAEIDRRMEAVGLTDAEILHRLKEQATADYEELIVYDDWGYHSLDIAGFLKAGKGHLIKELREERGQGGKAKLTVKLHDAQTALLNLAKIKGMFKDDRPQWQIEIVNLVIKGEATIEQVEEEFGSDLVADLFKSASAS